MAFLVSYSGSLSDHTTNRAIYLDDKFYKLIFRKCCKESAQFAVLREIAMLRYKSPTIMLEKDRIEHLIQELEHLEHANCKHDQIPQLRNVCLQAIETSNNLTISADMHRELIF